MTSNERKQARYLRRKAKREEKRKTRNAEYDDFDIVFSFEHLWKSLQKCCKNVGWKTSTQKIRNRPITSLAKTYTRLHNGTYKSNGFYEFRIIERGKERQIKSVHISERVVQKCLCDYCLTPIFLPTLIYDNAASIKGKGIDFTKRRLVKHLRQEYAKYGNGGYALVYDFSKYFDRIEHETLLQRVAVYITDGRILALFTHFVKCFGERGLGLGSQISQNAAIFYPNELDHVIKDGLRIKGDARYMDDGYLISHDIGTLRNALKVMTAICDKYGIVLNKKKTQIVKLSRGIPFLKHRFILTDTGKIVKVPFKDSARAMKRKIKVFSRWIIDGKMPKADAVASFESWKSHLLRSNAYHCLRKMDLYAKQKIYNITEVLNNGKNKDC